MERLGLLAVLLPELAALRGVPQAKPLAGDALDHPLRAADALPAVDPVLRIAGLLHDVGKATTLADGHFLHHDREGALMAEQILLRLHAPRRGRARGRLVRHHMFHYTPDWTDAAVRRFVRRVGIDLLTDFFELRAADDAASGVVDPADGWNELRQRVASVVGDPLEAQHLAVNGDDLVAEPESRPARSSGVSSPASWTPSWRTRGSTRATACWSWRAPWPADRRCYNRRSGARAHAPITRSGGPHPRDDRLGAHGAAGASADPADRLPGGPPRRRRPRPRERAGHAPGQSVDGEARHLGSWPAPRFASRPWSAFRTADRSPPSRPSRPRLRWSTARPSRRRAERRRPRLGR